MDNKEVNSFESEMSINDYLYIFNAHSKKIITLIILGTIVSTYYTFTIHPTYKASTSVIIREKPGSSMVMNIGGQKTDTRMTNEIQLIKSRKVAKEVVHRLWESDSRNSLNIFGTRVFYPKGERVRRLIKELASLGLYNPKSESAKSYDTKYSDEIGEEYASNIINGVNAVHRKSTDIIDISFQSVYANEAKTIANILAKVYKDFEKEISAEDANLSVLFLTDLVKQQEEKLVESEELIKKYSEIKRIRYTTSHPKDMTDDLIDCYTLNKKLMPFVHLPIQSGSNKILKLMNRKHTVESYIDIYSKLKKINPEIEFSSDFIISYPGETESDFKDTLNLIKKIKFINSFSFVFSPRPGTRASELKLIDKEISKNRLLIIQKYLFQYQQEMNKSFEKKQVDVLVENKIEEQNKLFGRNKYMNSVIFEGDKKNIGKIIKVKIEDSNQNSLFGKIEDNKDMRAA